MKTIRLLNIMFVKYYSVDSTLSHMIPDHNTRLYLLKSYFNPSCRLAQIFEEISSLPSYSTKNITWISHLSRVKFYMTALLKLEAEFFPETFHTVWCPGVAASRFSAQAAGWTSEEPQTDFLQSFKTDSGAQPAPIQRATGTISTEVKRPESKTNHSSQYNAKVKNDRRCTSTPLNALMSSTEINSLSLDNTPQDGSLQNKTPFLKARI